MSSTMRKNVNPHVSCRWVRSRAGCSCRPSIIADRHLRNCDDITKRGKKRRDHGVRNCASARPNCYCTDAKVDNGSRGF